MKNQLKPPQLNLVKMKKWIFKFAKITFTVWVAQIAIIILLRWIPIYFTPLILIRGIEKWQAGEKIGFTKKWVSYGRMHDHLKVAVICSEDQNFFKHRGFDLGAIEKAWDYNERQKKKGKSKRRGASTISQQTAKNVFLWPKRSWLRKALESWFTIHIELLWGKKRILEVYLNVVELGNGIYGAEAAAQKYWKKPASALSKYEAATLATLLPSPRKYSATKPGPYVQQRIQWVLQQMKFNSALYRQI